MSKSMFREIQNDEDVMDIVAKCFVSLALPSAMFVIIVALWTFFHTSVNTCGTGIC